MPRGIYCLELSLKASNDFIFAKSKILHIFFSLYYEKKNICTKNLFESFYVIMVLSYIWHIFMFLKIRNFYAIWDTLIHTYSTHSTQSHTHRVR